MRFAIIGVGGTGGYFGGVLARAGEDVAFIARGATLAALRERGLTVKSANGETFTLPVQATDAPATVAPVDCVLFCVKRYDTDAAAAAMRPLVGPDTVIIPVQNGMESAEQITAALGPGHDNAVIGGMAGISAVIESPGVVFRGSPFARIVFGEFDRAITPRVSAIHETLTRAGITSGIAPDINVVLWEKFAGICGLSGVTSLMRLPAQQIVRHPESVALFEGVQAEVRAVAAARGVAAQGNVLSIRDMPTGNDGPPFYGSMYFDFKAGRRTELDYLNGAVVRLGAGSGVPTPYNFAIYAALKPRADGAIAS